LIFHFAYPPKQEYLVGNISQYPPAGHPYSIEVDNKTMYLANTGNNILIFHWRTPGSTHCRYKWFDLEAAFIDPCSGARFSLDGSFLTGPPHRGLDRYSIRLEGGQIIVDLSETRVSGNSWGGIDTPIPQRFPESPKRSNAQKTLKGYNSIIIL
jgi:hypothetical protein